MNFIIYMNGFINTNLPLEKGIEIIKQLTNDNDSNLQEAMPDEFQSGKLPPYIKTDIIGSPILNNEPIQYKEQEKENFKQLVDNAIKDTENREAKEILKEKINSDEFKKYTEDFKHYLSSLKQVVKSPIVETFTIIINMQDIKNGDKNIPEDQNKLMKDGLEKLKQVYINYIVVNYPYKNTSNFIVNNNDHCTDTNNCTYKNTSTNELLRLIFDKSNNKPKINIIFCGYYGDTVVIYKLLDMIQYINKVYNNDNKIFKAQIDKIEKIYFSFAGTIFQKTRFSKKLKTRFSHTFNTFTPSPCNIRISINNNNGYYKEKGEKDDQLHANNLQNNIKNHRLWMFKAFNKMKLLSETIYFNNKNPFTKIKFDNFYILDYNGQENFYNDNNESGLSKMEIPFYKIIDSKKSENIDDPANLNETTNQGSIDDPANLNETTNQGSIDGRANLKAKEKPGSIDDPVNLNETTNQGSIDGRANLKAKEKPGSIDGRANLNETTNQGSIEGKANLKTKEKPGSILNKPFKSTLKQKPKPTGGKNRKTRKIKAKKTRKFRVKKPRKRSLR